MQVDLLSVKEIPVQAVFQGSVADGYVQDPIELEYDALEISGPQDSGVPGGPCTGGAGADEPQQNRVAIP